ncbi:MAG TPA: glutathione S-transferase family protein, partial [Anaerolineales bacterium]
FAEALGEGPYILCDSFSAADIYAAMLASWAEDVPALFARHPNIKAHYDRVTARPRIAKVWERNEV